MEGLRPAPAPGGWRRPLLAPERQCSHGPGRPSGARPWASRASPGHQAVASNSPELCGERGLRALKLNFDSISP